MFRIGELVVCVDAQPEPNTRWEFGAELRVGAIYTIIAVGPATVAGNPGVLVAETRRVPGFNYRSCRFRPVIDKQTDISCFTEILNRENKNSRVPVGHLTACEVNTNFRDLLKPVSDHQS